MSSIRLVTLLFLATPLLVPAASAAPDPCEAYGICVFRSVGDDWACAGAGFGLQGVVACAEADPSCVEARVGIAVEEEECVYLDAPAAPDCDEYPGCHGAFVSRNEDGVCAGYTYPYRGIIAGCLEADDGVCVVSGGEFWYARRCTGPLALP